MNDAHIDVYNQIFKTFGELNTRQQHIHNIKIESIQLSKRSK
jgi:hypothetical protein